MGSFANSLAFWVTIVVGAVGIVAACVPFAKFIHKQTATVVYIILVGLLLLTFAFGILFLSFMSEYYKLANSSSQLGSQPTPQNSVTNTPHDTVSPTLTTSTITTSTPVETSYSSTPLKTLNILCDAVRAEDYSTQWDQFDSDFRKYTWNDNRYKDDGYTQFSSGLKARDENNGGVVNCILSQVVQNADGSVSDTVTTTFNQGKPDIKTFQLKKNGDGVWRITGF